MVEAGSKEVSESDMLDALMFGHEAIKELCLFEEEIQTEIGKTKMEYPRLEIEEELRNEVDNLIRSNLDKFPKKFFIEDHKVFLRFLQIYVKIFGKDKLKNLINYPSLRSHTLKIFSEDYVLSNRWEYGEDRYQKCGHLLDGQCYVNSDRCMYCDIEKFIKIYEG